MRQRITVKDLARAAGVSIGTVDRALNGRPGINVETRQRVLSAAETLGYRRNKLAQSLGRKSQIKIGCVFPSRYSFYPDIEAGINHAAATLADHNVRVVSRRTENLGDEREGMFIDELVEAENVSALALCPSHSTRLNQKIDELAARGVPIVTIATDAPASRRLTCVSTDSFNNGQIAGDLMCGFLREGGRTVVLTGSLDVTDHERKVSGFSSVINGCPHGIEIAHVYETHDVAAECADAVTHALQTYPELRGIYVSTSTGASACQALKDQGRAGEVYLIGTDLFQQNIPFVQNGTIQALIFQNPFEQGRKAIEILYSHLSSDTRFGPTNFVIPSIITKHSVQHFRCYC